MPTQYVNGADLLIAITAWKKEYTQAQKLKEELPGIPAYIGECCVKIAYRLASKPNFGLYTYRDEMIGDALESCCRYLHNFDPAKSDNAFAYITQIVHNSFVRRIQREQKQSYVKAKMIDALDTTDSYDRQDGDIDKHDNTGLTFLQETGSNVIEKYETRVQTKKTRAKEAADKRKGITDRLENV